MTNFEITTLLSTGPLLRPATGLFMSPAASIPAAPSAFAAAATNASPAAPNALTVAATNASTPASAAAPDALTVAATNASMIDATMIEASMIDASASAPNASTPAATNAPAAAPNALTAAAANALTAAAMDASVIDASASATNASASATHPYRDMSEPAHGDDLRIPYRGQARMRLALAGLAHGRIVIDPAAEDLIAIQCGDDVQPRMRVTSDEIAVSYHVSFGDWLRGALRPGRREIVIVLHPAVEWTLASHGGLASCELELAAGAVARIDVDGGCSGARFMLPPVARTVPIRITGGAADVVVQRPADIGVVLATAGGMSKLRLDEQQLDAIGGAARLETRNVTADSARYELTIHGGASGLAIERSSR